MSDTKTTYLIQSFDKDGFKYTSSTEETSFATNDDYVDKVPLENTQGTIPMSEYLFSKASGSNKYITDAPLYYNTRSKILTRDNPNLLGFNANYWGTSGDAKTYYLDEAEYKQYDINSSLFKPYNLNLPISLVPKSYGLLPEYNPSYGYSLDPSGFPYLGTTFGLNETFTNKIPAYTESRMGRYLFWSDEEDACYYTTTKKNEKGQTIEDKDSRIKLNDGPGIFLIGVGAGAGGQGGGKGYDSTPGQGGGAGASVFIYMDLKYLAQACDLYYYNNTGYHRSKYLFTTDVEIKLGDGGAGGAGNTTDTSVGGNGKGGGNSSISWTSYMKYKSMSKAANMVYTITLRGGNAFNAGIAYEGKAFVHFQVRNGETGSIWYEANITSDKILNSVNQTLHEFGVHIYTAVTGFCPTATRTTLDVWNMGLLKNSQRVKNTTIESYTEKLSDSERIHVMNSFWLCQSLYYSSEINNAYFLALPNQKEDGTEIKPADLTFNVPFFNSTISNEIKFGLDGRYSIDDTDNAMYGFGKIGYTIPRMERAYTASSSKTPKKRYFSCSDGGGGICSLLSAPCWLVEPAKAKGGEEGPSRLPETIDDFTWSKATKNSCLGWGFGGPGAPSGSDPNSDGIPECYDGIPGGDGCFAILKLK